MYSEGAVHLHYREFQDDEDENTEMASRLLFLFVSYLFLLVFIYLFIRKCINQQCHKYEVNVLPSDKVLGYEYGGVVLLMGGIGLFCVIEDAWTTHAWIYYFFSNVLIAVLIYVYQTNKQYTLFIVTSFAIVLSIMLQLLFIESGSMEKGESKLVIRNLVGGMQAWAVVSTVMVLGQWAVHDLRMSKHCQSILFFIFTVAITIILALWNRKEGYGKWNNHYGFCISSSLLIFISLISLCEREQEQEEYYRY